MADPGEGPRGPSPFLFLDQTGARRAENIVFETESPLLSQGLDDRAPPPLSEGLERPLH